MGKTSIWKNLPDWPGIEDNLYSSIRQRFYRPKDIAHAKPQAANNLRSNGKRRWR
jgi:hypothetical protein